MPTNTQSNSCSEFLVDLFANRIGWIERNELISLALHAGFRESRILASLRSCWHVGLVSRSYRNVQMDVRTAPWHTSSQPQLLDSHIRVLMQREVAARHAGANPIQLVGTGALTSGLLGTPRISQLDVEQLVAELRLSGAFKQHLANGFEPETWRRLNRTRMHGFSAATAIKVGEGGEVRQLIVTPAPMNAAILKRLIVKLDQMEVAYELW
jgi:hypothetical protein